MRSAPRPGSRPMRCGTPAFCPTRRNATSCPASSRHPTIPPHPTISPLHRSFDGCMRLVFMRLLSAWATTSMPATDPCFVDFRDVWLAYGQGLRGPFAVEAIDLQVPQGAFSAIVGPSGCGKSPFMKLATGLQLPSRGRILIDGRAVTGPLKISGMAFQAPSLLPWRNILDNVLLPLEIVEPYRSQFKQQRRAYAERARQLLHKVGLAGHEERFPWQL